VRVLAVADLPLFVAAGWLSGVLAEKLAVHVSLHVRALDAGAAVMVTSHLGRPKEGVWSQEDSLAPVAKRLSELLGREVPLVKDWLDQNLPGIVEDLVRGEIERVAQAGRRR